MKSWAAQNKTLLCRAASGAALVVPAMFAGLAHAQQHSGNHRSSQVHGKALLAQYQCGACHTIPGVPAARGEVAQTLRAWSRRSYIAGRLPNRPDVLARWIADPQSLVPGTAMPSMGVAPADARAMAAYLFSLE